MLLPTLQILSTTSMQMSIGVGSMALNLISFCLVYHSISCRENTQHAQANASPRAITSAPGGGRRVGQDRANKNVPRRSMFYQASWGTVRQMPDNGARKLRVCFRRK